MLDRFKSRLIVQDGMKVEPFTEKIEIEYDKKYKNQIPNLADYLATIFVNDSVILDKKKDAIRVGKINLKFSPKKDVGAKGTVMNTEVQEEGTTVILNQVLKHHVSLWAVSVKAGMPNLIHLLCRVYSWCVEKRGLRKKTRAKT